jgi:hypothetical protein
VLPPLLLLLLAVALVLLMPYDIRRNCYQGNTVQCLQDTRAPGGVARVHRHSCCGPLCHWLHHLGQQGALRGSSILVILLCVWLLLLRHTVRAAADAALCVGCL